MGVVTLILLLSLVLHYTSMLALAPVLLCFSSEGGEVSCFSLFSV